MPCQFYTPRRQDQALALVASATASFQCAPGHYINTDPRGLFMIDGKTPSDYQKCDLNKTTGQPTGGDGSTFISCQCRRCPANTVSQGWNDTYTQCSECPSSYKANPRQDSCVPCFWKTCPAGTYNSAHSYNDQSFCGSQQCRPCPPGTYQATSHVGTTSCTACPAHGNGSPGVQTNEGKSCDTLNATHLPSYDPVDHTHGGKIPTGYKCKHTKCFLEMGRHGEVVLRSHHHRKEYPQSNWTTLTKRHHCKVYHPAGLRPAYCECTCYDEDPLPAMSQWPHNVPNANVTGFANGVWPDN